jgi:hypothetical protein
MPKGSASWLIVACRRRAVRGRRGAWGRGACSSPLRGPEHGSPDRRPAGGGPVRLLAKAAGFTELLLESDRFAALQALLS